MVLRVKNIRKSSGVSNCTTIEFDNTKYIILNRTDRLEIYDSDLLYIKKIELGIFISFINTAHIDNEEYLILLTTQDTYFILESKSIFQLESLNGSKPLDKQGKIDANYVYNSSLFKSSMIYKDILLIFSYSGDVLSYTIRKDRLIFDDFPNDFKYFEILDVSSDGMYLVFLTKDVEGSVSVLKYFSEGGKLQLKSKISREDNFQKKSTNEGFLQEGIKKLDILRNGYLSIGKDILIYEDGDTIYSEFGNTFVKTKCHFGNKILYSMEDGELIQVEILNKKINRSRSTQTINSVCDSQKKEDDLLPDSLKFEKATKKIQTTVLHKFTEGFKFMKVINKNTLLVGNRKAVKLIRLESSCVEIINKLRYIDGIEGATFSCGKYHVWDNNRIYVLEFSLESTFNDISKMNGTIHKFMVLGDILIVGYSDRGLVLRNKSECLLETDSILNVVKETSPDEYKVYFNTRKKIFVVTDKEIIRSIECRDIILSSFYKDLALIYTKNYELKLVDVCKDTVVTKKIVKLEISTLILCDYVVLSTYDGCFIIMDLDFNILKKTREKTFIHSTSMDGRLFFSDSQGSVFECLVRDKDVEFIKLYRSYSTITSLSCLEDSLLVISDESVLINLSKMTKYRISITDISGGCFHKNYFFSKGRKIISCSLRDEPRYNFFMNNFLSNRGNNFTDFISYLPKKEIIITTDKIDNTTVFIKNQDEMLRIKDFICISGDLFGDVFVLAGYSGNKGLILTVDGRSKGVIENVENDHSVSVLQKEIDEIVNMYIRNEVLLVSNSSTILYYEKTLSRPLEVRVDFTIHKLYYYQNYILVLDYFRSFGLLEYSTKDSKFIVVGSPNLPYKFDTGLLTEKFLIVSSSRDVFVYEIKTMNMLFKKHMGSPVVAIEPYSLEIDGSNEIFIFTSDSSIFCLHLSL